MVKNHSNSYDALRIRRSSDVAAKAGYLQFVLSDGFKSINDCTDFDSQWVNYSISKVISRELLEECFGIDEDDERISGNNVTPDKIYHNQHIKTLIDMIVNQKKAKLELVEIVESLVSLRQEHCSVLKVDDEDFVAYLASNYESKTAIHLVDIRNLEKESFWVEGQRYDLAILNCTSAGLFELARNSHLYKEALSGCEKDVR